MSFISWLLGRKKRDQAKQKASDYFSNEEKNEDYWRRKRKRDSNYDNDLSNPMNPLSPLWIGNQHDFNQDQQQQTPSVEYGGGNFGGGGSSSDWSPPDNSSNDSGSSFDSGSSCDSGGSSGD